jgi:predicted house-cleaning noncanonical NTP pyrophosphatase (MazG superfamily)
VTTLRGKLVRDRIPEIIRQSGRTPILETASPKDYEQYVRAKLQEELREYLESGDATELADLIEVCFAAAALRGVSRTELLAIAEDKRVQRGAFAKRLVWLGNDSDHHELMYRPASYGLRKAGIPDVETPHWYCTCGRWRVDRDLQGRPFKETAQRRHREHIKDVPVGLTHP